MEKQSIRPLDVCEAPLTGIHLIEASAGTGKTRAITDLYVRCLLETERQVSQILVVTFTVAATAELRDRIRRRLVEASPCIQWTADRRPVLPAPGDDLCELAPGTPETRQRSARV